MSEIDLNAIEKICHSSGGMKVVAITPLSNVSFVNGVPTVLDANKEYLIVFKRYSGSYSERSVKTNAGKYILQSLSMYIPKYRFDVEYIVSQLLDNRCHVRYIDSNQASQFLIRSTLNHEYNSGKTLSDPNGYKFEFTAKTRKKYKSMAGEGIQVPIGEPQDPGEETGTIDNSTTGGNSTPPYYVVINPTPIPTTPTASGNTTFLNQFVIGADGFRYFIDHLGNSIEIREFPKYRKLYTFADFVGNTVTVDEPLPTDMSKVIVTYNRTKVEVSEDPLTAKTYSRAGQDLTFFRVTADTTVSLLW